MADICPSMIAIVCPNCYHHSPRSTKEEKFWLYVDKSKECWEWCGAVHPVGYGSFSAHSFVHRYSYELAYGPIPDGMWVCHKCDNRLCVRPSHLFLGTPADNTADMLSKGRNRRKLSAQEVIDLRIENDNGTTHADLARKYKVSISAIKKIVNSTTWKHVAYDKPKRRLHKRAKLTPDMVKEIRSLRKEGWKYDRLAKRFEVSISTISDIFRGRNWKHVT